MNSLKQKNLSKPPVSSKDVLAIRTRLNNDHRAQSTHKKPKLFVPPSKRLTPIEGPMDARHARDILNKKIGESLVSTQIINSVNDAKKARNHLRQQVSSPIGPRYNEKMRLAKTRVGADSGKPPEPPHTPIDEPPLDNSYERKRPSKRLRKIIAIGAAALALVGASFTFRSSHDSDKKVSQPVATTSIAPTSTSLAKHSVSPPAPSVQTQSPVEKSTPTTSETQPIILDNTAETPWDAAVARVGEEKAAQFINDTVDKSHGQLIEHGSGTTMWISTINGQSISGTVIETMNQVNQKG